MTQGTGLYGAKAVRFRIAYSLTPMVVLNVPGGDPKLTGENQHMNDKRVWDVIQYLEELETTQDLP